MSQIAIFLISAGIALAVSIAVAAFIRRHLRNVLTDLTGTAARAEFWIAFTTLLLVLIPLIVLMFVPYRVDGDTPVFFEVMARVRWSLVGLVGTLISYGLIIIAFVQTRPPQSPNGS